MIIERLREWQQPPLNDDIPTDQRYVMMLLLGLVDTDELAKFNVSDDIMQFIHGKIIILN